MLYPPIIEGTLPSFGIKKGTGATLSVPFSMNEAVGQNEVKGFSIRIKSVIQNEVLLTMEASSFSFLSNQALFTLTATEASLLNIGQFYKVQLAYIDNNNIVGYYSTVGVIKCTGQPTVYIEGLETYSTNSHRYNYTGYYKNTDDSTEKVYSYQFILMNSQDEIVKDSGMILHNSQINVSDTESCDSYNFSFDLDKGKTYFIKYKVITNNQMEIESIRYKIRQSEFISMEVPATLNATLNYDNGYVDIVLNEGPKGYWRRRKGSNEYIEGLEYWIKKRDIDGNITGYESAGEIDEETFLKGVYYTAESLNNYYISGNFIITKSSNISDFKEWDKVATIKVEGRGPVFVERKDFSVEQGKIYKYAIQQYNDYGMLSERYITPEVYVDFEDMFLTDGDRQLKLRFNPKVASFKTDRLEAKVDTIGSKYPFIFRNEHVEYKEFSIAGLLSYWTDENNLFMTDDELGLYPDVNKRRATAPSDKEPRLNFLQAQIDNLNTKLYSEEDEWVAWRVDYASEDELIEAQQQLEDYQNAYTQLLLTRTEQSELKTNLNNNMYKTHNFTDRNFAAERIFKLEVLDWLNNGKPKLFRSPGEGNYIVRLMNISLSPEDNLGRLLHTVSGTAYEIAECSYENLVDLDIVRVDTLVFKHLLYKTKRLSWSGYNDGATYDPEVDGGVNPYLGPDGKIVYDYTDTLEFLFGELIDAEHICYSVLFTDMQPGTQVVLDGQVITIGATGSYYAEYENGITNIYIPSNNYYQGSITYSYYGIQHLEFDLIISENIEEHACRQFIGDGLDIIEKINDVKTELVSFYYLNFFKRPILDVNYYQYDAYFDSDGNQVYFYSDYEDGKYFYYNEKKKEYQRFYVTPQAEDDMYSYKYNSSISDEKFQEYLEEQKTSLILNTTFYKTKYGEDSLVFLPDAYKNRYTKKRREKLYYKDLLNNTEYFDQVNNLYLYRFDTNKLIINDKEYELTDTITVLKDVYRDKYLVSEEVYNSLPNTIKYADVVADILAQSVSEINEQLYGKEMVLTSDWYSYAPETATYLGYILNNGEYYDENNQIVTITKAKVDEYLAYQYAIEHSRFEVYNTKTTINAEYIVADDYSSRRLASDDVNLPYGKYYSYNKETKTYEEATPLTSVGEVWIDDDREAVWDEVNQKYDYNLKYYVYNIEKISIDLELEEDYTIPNIDSLDLDTIPLPNGLYLNTGYKVIVSTYSIENSSQDDHFLNYKETLETYKTAIETGSTFYDDVLSRNASNIEDLLAERQTDLIEALQNRNNATINNDEYEDIIQEYLDFLDIYELYLSGELDLNDTTTNDLQVIANQILIELDEARENYYDAYEKYVTRLEWLIKKYREEGDYAYDY